MDLWIGTVFDPYHRLPATTWSASGGCWIPVEFFAVCHTGRDGPKDDVANTEFSSVVSTATGSVAVGPLTTRMNQSTGC